MLPINFNLAELQYNIKNVSTAEDMRLIYGLNPDFIYYILAKIYNISWDTIEQMSREELLQQYSEQAYNQFFSIAELNESYKSFKAQQHLEHTLFEDFNLLGQSIAPPPIDDVIQSQTEKILFDDVDYNKPASESIPKAILRPKEADSDDALSVTPELSFEASFSNLNMPDISKITTVGTISSAFTKPAPAPVVTATRKRKRQEEVIEISGDDNDSTRPFKYSKIIKADQIYPKPIKFIDLSVNHKPISFWGSNPKLNARSSMIKLVDNITGQNVKSVHNQIMFTMIDNDATNMQLSYATNEQAYNKYKNLKEYIRKYLAGDLPSDFKVKKLLHLNKTTLDINLEYLYRMINVISPEIYQESKEHINCLIKSASTVIDTSPTTGHTKSMSHN
jgi:hypothetical protein